MAALAGRVRLPALRYAGGWRLADGRVECGDCSRRTSVTAGTIFDKTRTPLTVWFHACWLFATAKDGISARICAGPGDRLLSDGLAMLHRLRSALVRPDAALPDGGGGRDVHRRRSTACARPARQEGPTGIAVEIGEPSIAGADGRAATRPAPRSPVRAAASSRQPRHHRRLVAITACRPATPTSGATRAAPAAPDPGELLPAVHRSLAVQAWLLAPTRHRPAHLQAYLNEFAFRSTPPLAQPRMVFYRVLTRRRHTRPYDDIRATRAAQQAAAATRHRHPPSLPPSSPPCNR